MKQFLFFLLSFFVIKNAEAQYTRYIIQLKNKATNPFSLSNPSSYLSQKSLDRRTTYNINLDSTDLPITPRYIDSIRLSGNVIILNKSKWLNQVAIKTTDATAINKILTLPFVASISTVAAKPSNNNSIKPSIEKDLKETISQENIVQQKNQSVSNFYDYGLTTNEAKLHNVQFLHNIGMRGQNMLLAIIDAGFYRYTSLSSFDSMNLNNRVKDSWDFVSNHASVVEDDSHGMSCLSTIVGNIPGNFIGNAPETNVLLYRSEEAATEYPIEEFNWVCAAERADSAGATVITTSLGYSTFDDATFNYTYSQMNGRTTIAAKGGVFAHRKGMLLFTAMGNEGGSSWKYLSTPADIDSTISVGAVNVQGIVSSFSSYGPSADGRVKPEASAVGWNAYVQSSNNTIMQGNGTSYACPKMAGMGVVLWQAFPEFKNYTIREAIIKSGSNYFNPNDRIGYGIPDMKKAFSILLQQYAKITNATNNNCNINIQWKSKDVAIMKYIVQRKLSNETYFTAIKEIQGNGNILSNKNYSIIDTVTTTTPIAHATYRIQQIIDTATTGNNLVTIDSITLSVDNCNIVLNESFTISPNPTKNSANLKIETPYPIDNLWIRITDLKGSILSNQKYSKNAGTSIYKLPVEFLAKGMYVVTIYNDKKIIATQKLIKQ